MLVRTLEINSPPPMYLYLYQAVEKRTKFSHLLVVVQLIHRLTQADISCPRLDLHQPADGPASYEHENDCDDGDDDEDNGRPDVA